MVWYGLIECAVHVHRQVVTSRQLAPPAVWAAALLQCGAEKESTCHRALTCFCVRQHYSCLCCKLAACAVRWCSKCASHKVKNSSVEERHQVHENCDKAALLLWHVFSANNAPMLWWYSCLQKVAPRVGVPWQFLVRRTHHRWRQIPP